MTDWGPRTAARTSHSGQRSGGWRGAVTRCGLLLGFTCSAAGLGAGSLRAEVSTSELRQPVALAVSQTGDRALVANRKAGSISVVDLPQRRVVFEAPVGQSLADLAWDGRSPWAFAVDDQRHELLVLNVTPTAVHVASRVAVASYPVKVERSPDGRTVFVTSLWSRRLTRIDVADVTKPQVRAQLDLPFAPREMCLIPDLDLLVVADAFGGQLARIDTAAFSLASLHELPGHNLRGLTWDAEQGQLLLTHPILHADEATTEGGVHWGGVMSNVVRAIPAKWLRSPGSDLGESLYYLGHPDRATGDPAGLIVTPTRRQVVAYAGLGELGVSDIGANVFDPIPVGTGPSALALSPDGSTVIVANRLDDSLSVVQLRSPPVVEPISLGPTRERTAEERGELLFYNARLASDGWFSCHTCHTDGHSNGGRSDTLGDASFGAPKRVLSLLGVRDSAPWAWTGQVTRLEEQIAKSVDSTMRGPRPTEQQVQDLAAFLGTFTSPPSLLSARYGDQLSAQRPDLARAVRRGEELFAERDCSTCHTPPAYTSEGSYDVGLADERGSREFNPPSLRGVSQRDRLFHDNRSSGLSEVFAKFQHGLDEPLSEQQIGDLVAFLQTL